MTGQWLLAEEINVSVLNKINKHGINVLLCVCMKIGFEQKPQNISIVWVVSLILWITLFCVYRKFFVLSSFIFFYISLNLIRSYALQQFNETLIVIKECPFCVKKLYSFEIHHSYTLNCNLFCNMEIQRRVQFMGFDL